MIDGNIIYKVTCKHFDLDLSSELRTNQYIYSRAVFYKLCRTLTLDSLEKIGKYCKKDHASVLNSLRKYDDVYCKHNEAFIVHEQYSLLLSKIEYIKKNYNENYKKYEKLSDYIDELKRELINYNVLKSDYNTLKTEYDELKEYNDKLNEELGICLQSSSNERLDNVISLLSKLSNDELLELEKLRIIPFLKMKNISTE